MNASHSRRVATALQVFIGHVNSQACGFPNAVAQPTCTAAGQLASGYADNPKPNQLNMPPRETGPQGPTCLYRSPFPESLQLEANLGECESGSTHSGTPTLPAMRAGGLGQEGCFKLACPTGRLGAPLACILSA